MENKLCIGASGITLDFIFSIRIPGSRVGIRCQIVKLYFISIEHSRVW